LLSAVVIQRIEDKTEVERALRLMRWRSPPRGVAFRSNGTLAVGDAISGVLQTETGQG